MTTAKGIHESSDLALTFQKLGRTSEHANLVELFKKTFRQLADSRGRVNHLDLVEALIASRAFKLGGPLKSIDLMLQSGWMEKVFECRRWDEMLQIEIDYHYYREARSAQ